MASLPSDIAAPTPLQDDTNGYRIVLDISNENDNLVRHDTMPILK